MRLTIPRQPLIVSQSKRGCQYRASSARRSASRINGVNPSRGLLGHSWILRRPTPPTLSASSGDEPRPEEAADLRSFFEYDDDSSASDASLDDGDIPSMDDPLNQGNAELEEPVRDAAERDRLAYERLIIEGADVENAEAEMEDMDATISRLQESYLDGSAYAAAQEPDVKPRNASGMAYPPMPEFEMTLVELLKKAKMHRSARYVEDRWEDDVSIRGMQSHVEHVKQGDVFFAYTNENIRGIEDISKAIDLGAAAIIIEDSSKDEDHPVEDNNGKKPTEEERLGRLLERLKLPKEAMSDVPIVRVDDMEYSMGHMGSIFYGHPSAMMRVVGVVGSEGKTSVAWILRQIFESFTLLTGIVCDIEYSIYDDQLTEEGDLFIPTENDPSYRRGGSPPYHHVPYKGRYSIDSTVLDPLQIQKVLAGMAYRGARACVIECPIESIADGFFDHVRFDVMVHLNLHSESEDDPESFDVRKSVHWSLFRFLEEPEIQRAIVNIDDDWAQEVIDASSQVPVVTYSLTKPEADVRVESAKHSQWESEMMIRTPLGNLQIITPMIGAFMAENILAAVATAVSMEVDLNSIVSGIESLDFIPGRCELVDKGQDFSVVVDNADTPRRLVHLISQLRKVGVKRVFLVIGCSYYHSPEDRKAIGDAAHHHADIVIFTSDSPGREAPNTIIDDIIEGFPASILERSEMWVLSPWQDPGRIPWWFEEWLFRAQKEIKRHIVEDRGIAIRGAIGTARKGDMVIVAGRGDRDYSLWPDKDDNVMKTWFEDRVESRDALIKLPHLHKSEAVTDHLPWTESTRTPDVRSRLS